VAASLPKKRLSRLTKWLLVLLVLAAAGIALICAMTLMPGTSYRGPLPALTAEEEQLKAELMRDVQRLGGEIGERNVNFPTELAEAADFIEQSFAATGLRTRRDTYHVGDLPCHNIEAELPGTDPGRIVVIGAHYDSAPGNPGANDNGSGVAAVLALARRFAKQPCTQTIRFVAFVNEEPVHFQTQQMGSWVYASRCKARGEQITGMISMETIGYFTDEPDSQQYPGPGMDMIYPNTGNFIAFVGNTESQAFVRKVVESFRRHARFPSEGTALPSQVPGVGWSDHWSFWQYGYPALMVTDTAPFRYPHYHRASDTPEKLDYDGMTRVVAGMAPVLRELADARE
jgi:hypothetical protein